MMTTHPALPTVAANGEGDAWLRMALEAGELGAWKWRISKDELLWSEEQARLHGLPRGQCPGTFTAYEQLVHPEDRAGLRAAVDSTLRHQRVLQLSYRIIRPDGQVRWIETTGRVLSDAEGKPDRVLGISRDVTSRGHMEELREFLGEATAALSETLDPQTVVERFARLVVPRLADWCVIHLVKENGMPCAVEIVHTDPDKAQLAWEVERRWPLPQSAPVGWPLAIRTGESLLQSRLPPERLAAAAQSPEHLTRLQSLGLRSTMVVPLKARGRVLGAVTMISAESRRSYSSDDLQVAEALTHRAALAIDNATLFADLRRARDALEERYVHEQSLADQAQKALRARENLLAMVSHDLRGPLSVIGLQANSLLRDAEDKRQLAKASPEGGFDLLTRWPAEVQRSAEVLLRHAERMQRMIRDMLDFSAIDAGHLTVFPEPQVLADLLGQAVEAAGALSGERRIELQVDETTALLRVMCDASRVLQVLDNLIGNAIKFTDPRVGRIVVGCEQSSEHVVVKVEDNGTGIASEALPHLFERFWQARDRVSAGTRDGVGLGLFIAKGLVEAQGGTIWMASEPGRGSSFYFSLPRTTDAASEAR